MKLSHILEVLYSEPSDDNKIIGVLNNTIHVRDFTYENNSMIIHLGFTFKIHTGTLLELFYDFNS